jgi:hypothetical protein
VRAGVYLRNLPVPAATFLNPLHDESRRRRSVLPRSRPPKGPTKEPQLFHASRIKTVRPMSQAMESPAASRQMLDHALCDEPATCISRSRCCASSITTRSGGSPLQRPVKARPPRAAARSTRDSACTLLRGHAPVDRKDRPVANRLSSQARKRIASAISSGVPSRPMGWRASSPLRKATASGARLTTSS